MTTFTQPDIRSNLAPAPDPGQIVLRDYQEHDLARIRALIRAGHRRILLVQPTGCHAIGQRVLLADGSLRAVEDVAFGDRLMGPDSKSRTVVDLIRGNGNLFRIVPAKGPAFVVAEDHVMTLVRTNDGTGLSGQIIDISIRDYLAQSRTFKHIHKLFRAAVEFPSGHPLPIHPYLLGVLLGDGNLSDGASVCSGDDEVISELYRQAASIGLKIRRQDRGPTRSIFHLIGENRKPGKAQQPNQLRRSLRSLGLFGSTAGTKKIPHEYLLSSTSNRLLLLAGLIDTDGSLSHNGFDYITKSVGLAEDICFLTRSLGLAAYVKTCRKSSQTGFSASYARISISGDVGKVPCLVSRKQAAARQQKKNALRTGFSVQPVGHGDYFGFTLDGDGRYLLDDFTVTHNSGKGTLATFVVRGAVARGRQILFLANRRELVHDLSRRLDRLGLDHGIIMGTHPRRNPWLSVHVASVDTLRRRETLPRADVLIIDEAHFSVSPIYQRVLERYPDSVLLGMTATPVRLDGRGLGEIYQDLVLGPSVAELTARGYLVPDRVFAPAGSEPDVSGVRTSAGDFNQKQLAQACDRTQLVGDIVEHWQRLASDRKTVVFGVDQAHARHIAEQFRSAGIQAAYVDAETPDQERDRIWDDLDNGSLPVVCSVNTISYGWDHPIVSCCILARPTQSMGLHLQQIGRGKRPAPGKANLLVLDHAGNTARHGFSDEPREWTLDSRALKSQGDMRALSVRMCRQCWAAYSSRLDACPYCGAPCVKQVREIETIDGQLEEFRREEKTANINAWRARQSVDNRRRQYDEWVAEGRARGYKPAWPAVRYHVVYKEWPPRAWRREVIA